MTSRMTRLAPLALTAALVAPVLLSPPTPAAAAEPKHHSKRVEPIVIGHRGASGYRPEHTLASYRLAIRLGADYVEPDLVSTKDGVLVARHENEISGTTDVADRPEFTDRKTTKTIDGRLVTGWFTEDFTLAELKTLRAKERLPEVRPDNTRYDGRFEVPTFQEVLDLVKEESRRSGRRIGVYPETKHPTYFDSIGLSLEEPLVRTLRRNGLDKKGSRVFVQSFETGNLRDLDEMTKAPLVQLVDAQGAPYDLVAAGDPRKYADLITPDGLDQIAEYADGLGANKDLVLPRDPATGETGATQRAGGRRPRGGPHRARVDAPRREPVHGHQLPTRGQPQREGQHLRRDDRVPRGRRRRHVRRLPRLGGRCTGRVGGYGTLTGCRWGDT